MNQIYLLNMIYEIFFYIFYNAAYIKTIAILSVVSCLRLPTKHGGFHYKTFVCIHITFTAEITIRKWQTEICATPSNPVAYSLLLFALHTVSCGKKLAYSAYFANAYFQNHNCFLM